MKRFISIIAVLLLVVTVANSQETTDKKESEKPAKKDAEVITSEGNVYQEIVVEDFEKIEFKKSDIIFQKSRDEVYKVAMRDEFPAPVNNSKKYLGVKLRGSRSNAIQIKFPKGKVPEIKKYCKSISVWVYGKRFSGELSLFLMDGEGRTHRLSFGKLNFHGWYKLTKVLTEKINQTDKFLERGRTMKILSILYVPGTWYKFATNVIDPAWQTFYVDDTPPTVQLDINDDHGYIPIDDNSGYIKAFKSFIINASDAGGIEECQAGIESTFWRYEFKEGIFDFLLNHRLRLLFGDHQGQMLRQVISPVNIFLYNFFGILIKDRI